MYFRESGNVNGQTIVFLHGGGVGGWMWDKQIESFHDFHCLVPDLPEHGKSLNEGPISISDCVDLVAHLIEDKANNRKAHVVGHSLGGKVVIELLSKRPDLVGHAVTASALYRPMFLLKLTHKPYIYKMTAAMMKSRAVLSYTVRQFKFPDKSFNESCMQEFKNLTSGSLYRIYEQVYQHLKLPDGLTGVNVPALILAGEKEPKAMRQSVADITSVLPNSKGVIIKKANHTYPWSMHDTFNNLIRSWITKGSLDR